jgi:GMP synthase-like glutamine amidotransferase
MRIHYLQHEPYESLGSIEDWVRKKGHVLSATKFYEDTRLPELSTFDFLIIMGGPMGVNDENKYPWLKEEKDFIKKAIDHGKMILGICLGSQLIAAALGAKVYPNQYKEIGLMDVYLTKNGNENFLSSLWPRTIKVYQWHGDTFDLPKGAILLAESDICKNQAFAYKEHVLGLQFHLEFTEESLKELINNGRDELVKGKYVQTEEEILQSLEILKPINHLLYQALDRIEEKIVS